MTDVYIICSDGVFRRMLELELTEYGANVMPEGSAVTAPCAAVISAPDIDKAALPQDGCLTVVLCQYLLYPAQQHKTVRTQKCVIVVGKQMPDISQCRSAQQCIHEIGRAHV